MQDFPDVMVGGTAVAGTWYTAILFGVSSAMLGVSGFESSSQFVEEQAKGVFVKTLRNMQVLHVQPGFSPFVFNYYLLFLFCRFPSGVDSGSGARI